MWSFKLLISVYTSDLSELFDSALCVCVSLSALPCRGECVRNRLLMLSVFICVIGHFWLSSCLRVHFCAGIQFSFFPVCFSSVCTRVCLSLWRVCGCLHVHICACAHSQALFPLSRRGHCHQMSVPGNGDEQWSPRAKGQSPGEGQHQSVA